VAVRVDFTFAMAVPAVAVIMPIMAVVVPAANSQRGEESCKNGFHV